MLAVRKEKPEAGVVIKEIPVPEPKEEEVLVKVKYASICGTDIAIYDWTPWAQGHIQPPMTMGHEMVGEVIAINSKKKTNIEIGDMVSSETHIFCQNCYQCKMKNYHICENMQLFGIGRDGGFAQYATISTRTTWRNDSKIPVEAMSVQEPLGNAVNVVTKADVAGKKILVMGLGPTGLCAGMVAKAYGAKEVVGVNRHEYRRKLAKKLGFDRVTDVLDPKEFNSYDAVLEMSGNRIGIEIAFEAVRIGGKIIAFGIPKEDISIDWGKYLINKEITIGSVFGRMIWDTWKDTTKLLVSGKIDLRKIITHKFKLSEFDEAMKVMKSGECGKILLVP